MWLALYARLNCYFWEAFKGIYGKLHRVGGIQDTAEAIKNSVKSGVENIRKLLTRIRTKCRADDDSKFDSVPPWSVSYKVSVLKEDLRIELCLHGNRERSMKTEFHFCKLLTKDEVTQVHIIEECAKCNNLGNKQCRSQSKQHETGEDFLGNCTNVPVYDERDVNIKIISDDDTFTVTLYSNLSEFPVSEENIQGQQRRDKHLTPEKKNETFDPNGNISADDFYFDGSEPSDCKSSNGILSQCKESEEETIENVPWAVEKSCLRCEIIDCEKNIFMNELGNSLQTLNYLVKKLRVFEKGLFKNDCPLQNNVIVKTNNTIKSLEDDSYKKKDNESKVLGQHVLLEQKLETCIFERDELAKRLKELSLKYTSLDKTLYYLQNNLTDTIQELDVCISERNELAHKLEEAKLLNESHKFNDTESWNNCKKINCHQCSFLSNKYEELQTWLELKFLDLGEQLANTDHFSKETNESKGRYECLNMETQTTEDETFNCKCVSPENEIHETIIISENKPEELFKKVCFLAKENEVKSETISFSNAEIQTDCSSITNIEFERICKENKEVVTMSTQKSRDLEQCDLATELFSKISEFIEIASLNASDKNEIFQDENLLIFVEMLHELNIITKLRVKPAFSGILERRQWNKESIENQNYNVNELYESDIQTDDQQEQPKRELKSLNYCDKIASEINSGVLTKCNGNLSEDTELLETEIKPLVLHEGGCQTNKNIQLITTVVGMCIITLTRSSMGEVLEGTWMRELSLMPLHAGIRSSIWIVLKTRDSNDSRMEHLCYEYSDHRNNSHVIFKKSKIFTQQKIYQVQKQGKANLGLILHLERNYNFLDLPKVSDVAEDEIVTENNKETSISIDDYVQSKLSKITLLPETELIFEEEIKLGTFILPGNCITEEISTNTITTVKEIESSEIEHDLNYLGIPSEAVTSIIIKKHNYNSEKNISNIASKKLIETHPSKQIYFEMIDSTEYQLSSVINERDSFKKQVDELNKALKTTKLQLEEQHFKNTKMKSKIKTLKTTISEKDCLLEEFELALLGISPPGKMAAEAELCAQRDALAEDARRLRAALVFRNAEVESLRQQVDTFKALLVVGSGNTTRSRMEECRPVGGHKSAPAVVAGCSRTTPCDGSVRRRL